MGPQIFAIISEQVYLNKAINKTGQSVHLFISNQNSHLHVNIGKSQKVPHGLFLPYRASII